MHIVSEKSPNPTQQNHMTIEWTLDEKPHSLHTSITTPVSQLLREHCGRTDIPTGCAPQGSCGSCMVQVNGKPRLSCSLRAKSIHQKTLQSTQSIPLKTQKEITQAFMANGATQCGYCLPAIMHQTHLLLSHFENPTDEQIDLALKMHRCACMGYAPIKRAIQSLIHNRNHPPQLPNGWQPLRNQQMMWGLRNRIDDIHHPKMLYLYPILSKFWNSHFQGLDCSKWDLPADKMWFVDFQSHPNSIFSAPDTHIHQHDALLGLLISTEPLVLDDWLSLLTIHEEPKECQERKIESSFQKGTSPSQKLHFFEETITIKANSPAYLEPEGCVIVENHLFTNGLPPHIIQEQYPQYNIHSLASGGSFDGRTFQKHIQWTEWVAREFQRPCKMILSMNQSLRLRPQSPPARIHLKLGVQPSGKICSLQGEININIGADVSNLKAFAQHIAQNLHNGYAIEHQDIQMMMHCSAHNYQPLQDMGANYWTPAMETLVEKIAAHLQMDAISFRQLNLTNNLAKTQLDAITPHYIQALKEKPYTKVALSFASAFWKAPQAASIPPIAETFLPTCEVLLGIERSDCIRIMSPFPESNGFTSTQAIQMVSDICRIPTEFIHYQCQSEAQSNVHNHFASQILLLNALRIAAYEVSQALEQQPLTDLIGHQYLGKYALSFEDRPSNYCAALFQSDLEGDNHYHIAVNLGSHHNIVHAQSQLDGLVFKGLSQAKPSKHKKNDMLSLPSEHFKDLHMPLPKQLPKIHYIIDQQIDILPWSMVESAVHYLHFQYQNTLQNTLDT